MEDSPNILGLKETIALLEARFLQFSEIDKQRQLAVQKIASELNVKLEAKDCELQQVVSERDARANQAEEAQQALEGCKHQLEEKRVELAKVVEERDARAKEKGEAQ